MIRCVFAVAICALALGGCETTREKSARLAKSNDFKLEEQKGVEVKKTNRDVKVVETKVLTDDFGQAAVVVLKVDAKQPLVNVPVELTIVDKSGEQLFRNDAPGLDAALTGPAALPARGEVFWVYDQLTLAGKPEEAKAQVGAGKPLKSGELPQFKVEAGEFEEDADGVLMSGKISGSKAPEQRKLVVYGLARKRGEIIAVGTAQIEKLTPTRRARFQMFFVGDPKGAEIEFFVPPTVVS